MQWRLYLTMLVSIFLLAACSSTPTVRVGSQAWYDARLLEIETAYQNKEIDKAKYIELKNEVDMIRKDYQDLRDADTYFGYGHSRHGGRIGVGVGF